MAAPGDVVTIVRRAVARVLEVDVATVNLGTSFAALDADSLVLVAVADIVERALDSAGVSIDDAALADMRTVGDVVDYVVDRVPR